MHDNTNPEAREGMGCAEDGLRREWGRVNSFVEQAVGVLANEMLQSDRIA